MVIDHHTQKIQYYNSVAKTYVEYLQVELDKPRQQNVGQHEMMYVAGLLLYHRMRLSNSR